MSEPPPLRRYGRGVYIEGQVAGAWRNGSRVVKAAEEVGDATPVGTGATVLSSVCHPDVMGGALLYFVEWDTLPGNAVGVVGWKLECEGERR